MNTKRLITTVGLGALAVALVALPSSSARKQDPSSPQAKRPPQVVVEDGDVEYQVNELQNELNDLRFVQSFSDDAEDEQTAVVTSGLGWLGVGVSEVSAAKVKELKLPAEHGVVLGKIVPDSPAAKAGLKENDVITEINGQRVEGTEQFRRMIREIPTGRTAQITLWRDGHSQTVSVTIGKLESRHASAFVSPGTFTFHMPEMPQLNELIQSGPWFGGGPRLGIDAEDLEGEFGNYFGAPEGEGVLVRGVFPDSPAAKSGVKAGDVITSLDGDRVRSVGELREKMVEKKSEKSIKLGLLRNKAPLTLSVEMPTPQLKHEHHSSVRTNI
ncbi:MAG TPA: PDZ domain-containing protein [Candidatus Limnocylindrales bacterium]|nr:PDZ domain-containing protein [Candidatus Limnocylindrales bacterium]